MTTWDWIKNEADLVSFAKWLITAPDDEPDDIENFDKEMLECVAMLKAPFNKEELNSHVYQHTISTGGLILPSSLK